MDATISLRALFSIIFAIIGIGILAAALYAVIKVNQTLMKIREILNRNEKNINEALERIPRVVHNLEGITGGVNQEMEHIKGMIRNIDETVEYTASAAQIVTQDVVEPLKDILSILSVIKSLFLKRKKGWF